MSDARVPRSIRNVKFAAALDEYIEHISDLQETPFEVELESPLPNKIRVYLYSLTPSSRRNEYNIQPMDESLEDSGEHFVVLAGYNEEKDVFVLWDADLQQEFSYSQTVQIKGETLDGAVKHRIETQVRKLRKTSKKEVAIATKPESLSDAIIKRARREHTRSLMREHLPNDWDSSPSKQFQIEEVVLRFLLDERKYLPTEHRRLLAQESVADEIKSDLKTIQENCGLELYADEDGGDYHEEYFDPDLEDIEADWEGSDEPWQTSDAGTDVSITEDDSERDWGDWDLSEDTFETVEDHPSLSDLYFPSLDDEPSIAEQINTALHSDKHVILTGPPGSGKTEIAKRVCKHYVNDEYELTTATDDWSTFDTIGGYRPQQDDELEFEPGIFLRRFLEPGPPPEPKNEWLVIDELNRADIDKAFGSLFSALTGNNVTLPFDTERGQVTLHGDPDDAETPLTPHDYYVPEDWRLIATMNTDDKSSLYRLSYAFMRRFAFISVPVPTEIDSDRVGKYVSRWNVDLPDEDDIAADVDDIEERLHADLADLWSAVQEVNPVGPALFEDVLRHVVTRIENDGAIEYGPAITAHVLSQLEGVLGDEIDDILGQMAEDVTGFDRTTADRFAEDYLDVDLDADV